MPHPLLWSQTNENNTRYYTRDFTVCTFHRVTVPTFRDHIRDTGLEGEWRATIRGDTGAPGSQYARQVKFILDRLDAAAGEAEAGDVVDEDSDGGAGM